MIPTFQMGQLGLVKDGDPLWEQVRLLVSFEGTDGSTSLVDLSGRHTLSANGNAQIDTDDADFPNGALLLDGVSDYALTAGANEDFSYGGDDVTIEIEAKHSAFANGENMLLGNYAGGDGGFGLYINAASGAGTNIAVRQGDSVVETRSIALSTGVKRHYAFVRKGGVARLFVVGAKVGADITTMSGSLGRVNAIGIGSGAPTYPTLFETTGWIGWVRITMGARYWDDFTPPTTPYIQF